MPDPCQPIQQGIAQAQATKRMLQEDLQNAPPGQKASIIRLIKQVDEEVAGQRDALRNCREQHPAPLRPDVGWELGRCLDPTTRSEVERRLTETFAEINGVAHAECRESTERIGVWAPTIGGEPGRRAGLEFVNLVTGAGPSAFGMSLGLELINRRTRAANEVLPRVFDDNGVPNQTGPLFLSNGISFDLRPPATIVTTVQGFRRSPGLLPEVDFVVKIADTYRVAGAGDAEPAGTLAVDTSIDIDTSIPGLNVLAAALGAVLGPILAGLHAGIDIAVSSVDTGEVAHQGIGRALLAFFPTELALATGTVRFVYDRVEVFPGFILGGGRIQ